MKIKIFDDFQDVIHSAIKILESEAEIEGLIFSVNAEIWLPSELNKTHPDYVDLNFEFKEICGTDFVFLKNIVDLVEKLKQKFKENVWVRLHDNKIKIRINIERERKG